MLRCRMRDAAAISMHSITVCSRIEKRRLAGAIGSDDREPLAFAHIEIDAVGGDDAAEADDQAAGLQQGVLHQASVAGNATRRLRHRPTRPLGAKRMIAMSTMPRTSCQMLVSVAAA